MKYKYGDITPEEMTKLQMIADMLFNRSEDRSKYAKQIYDSLSGDSARDAGETLFFIRGKRKMLSE